MPSAKSLNTQKGPSIEDLPADAIAGIFDQLSQHKDRLNFAKTCKFINQCRYTYPWRSMRMHFGPSLNNPDSDPHCLRSCSSLLQCIKVDQWHAPVECSKRDVSSQGEYVSVFKPRARVKCSKRDVSSLEGHVSPKYTCKFHSSIDCARCSACALERTFGHADELLVGHKDMLFTRCFELSFTGRFGEANDDRYPDDRYPDGLTIADEYQLKKDLNTREWSATEIRSFQFNMYWKFWDMMILSSMSSGHLLTLKIPFPCYRELEALVRALSAMTQLRSLVVTDIPDQPDFPRYAPMLGQGIRSRKVSLRELDLEMTNFNRPDQYATEWERDEIFPRRNSLDWFFNDLFLDPKALDEWRKKTLPYKSPASECKEYALSPTRGQGLFKLEKLRLKNINVPAYASQKIFDCAHLKELRIPCGRVDDAIWKDLKAAKLEVLEDIDYTELTYPLIELLQSQSSLRSVTFARPQPFWAETGMADWNDSNGPQMTFSLVQYPAPLGPGTAWGRGGNWPGDRTPWYPDIETLLLALGNKKGLENLVLPADMYDITPAAIRMAARNLKSLTHLTWGFDYNDQACRTAFLHSFLPSMPHLRRLTFQSLIRPSSLPNFDAETLIKYVKPLGGKISPTLRYMRFLPNPQRYRGYGQEGGKTFVYYHRQEQEGGKWWMQFSGREGNWMYEQDRTPHVWPPRGMGHPLGREGRERHCRCTGGEMYWAPERPGGPRE